MNIQSENAVRQLITKLEVASDEIVRKIEITDISADALRRIKGAVSRISAIAEFWTEDEGTKYMPILERISSYLLGVVGYPEAIDVYAERIHSHVEKYLLLGRAYDAEYEKSKDLEMDSFIEIKRSRMRLDRLDQDMHRLAERKANGEIQADSPEYQEIVTRYDHLQRQKKQESYRMGVLQAVVEENDYIGTENEKAMAFEDGAALRTMTFEQFSRVAYENKERQAEEKAMQSAFARIAMEVNDDTPFFTASDANFQRAVEDTILERLAKDRAVTLDKEIAQIPKQELFEAIVQLNRKMDKLEQAVTRSTEEQKEQSEKTFQNALEMYTRILDAVALRPDLIDNLEKEVEYCLSRNPVDLQGAQLKVRSCIELYCRYKKGVDLNDSLFFRNKENSFAKFKIAGMSEEMVKEIAPIYKKTNEYIHENFSIFNLSEQDKRLVAQQLRESIGVLQKWGMDTYSMEEGIKVFWERMDQMLLERLDDGRIDAEFLESDQKSTNSCMANYFSRLNKIRDFMKENHIIAPPIRFLTRDDVCNYLAERSTAVNPRPIPTALRDGDSERLEGRITRYSAEKDNGHIDDKWFFYTSYLCNPERDAALCRVGARVSYIIGTNNRGQCAKEIEFVDVKEHA